MARVFYCVPEDGDDTLNEMELNCFIIQGKTSNELKVADVREAFPMPGQYHFRF